MTANNVLALFDGISCGQVALNRAGIKYDKYYASEIDKYAIRVTQKNFPETIQLGDVTKWREWGIDFSSIGIVFAGFPCQAWSIAGKQLGDKDERGKLFWVMLDIIKHVKSQNPNVKFIIENVKMKKEFEEYITFHTKEALGDVEKTLINSALVSAQNRNRYYWTNFPVSQPNDKEIFLKDIIHGHCDLVEDQGKTLVKEGIVKSHCLMARDYKGFGNQGMTGVRVFKEKSQSILATIYKENPKSMLKRGKMGLIVCGEADINGLDCIKRVYSTKGNSPTLSTCQGGHREPKIAVSNLKWRKLTPVECERLQTLADGYTEGISNTQRYKCLGNGWTVDIIAHILKGIK